VRTVKGGEGYCRYCCKMVPLVTGVVFSQLIIHFTFNMASTAHGIPSQSCIGVLPDNTITHYMDDPKAAFE
jgi:hypothetical protein